MPFQVEVANTVNANAGGYGKSVQGAIGDQGNIIAAAGDYAANDILSNSTTAALAMPWVFNGVARRKGGSGYITRMIGTCTATSAVARLRLWLFSQTPMASTRTDNAAFALALVDKVRLVGFIDLPAMSSATNFVYAQNIDVKLQFNCQPAEDTLYGILQTLDAETNEAASMAVTLELGILQD